MNKIYFQACSIGIILIAILSISAVESKPSNADAGLVRHIVTFRFMPNVSEEMQDDVLNMYLNLQYECTNISTGELYIVSQDGGYANSPEGKDQNMTQGYITTFSSIADRNYFVGRPFYYPYDPHHDAFKKFVGPLIQPPGNVFVFDFTVLEF